MIVRSHVAYGGAELVFTGLDVKFLEQCDRIVTIKQMGNVGSLNVAVSASTAMYEFNRGATGLNKIVGSGYQTEGAGNN